jgi:hypothetical protein
LNFISEFTHPESRFVGFDSFIGLPEDWCKGFEKGIFSTDGQVPSVNDPRARFVKGWFQNTISEAIDEISAAKIQCKFVHFDADLFSSTLYLLSSLHPAMDEYYCIFDEFAFAECRALLHYLQVFGAEVELYSAVFQGHGPTQVFGKIKTNRNKYQPN